jgi:2-amino-4-hydroxy-6-hydroxymethyldihydropteridine diphosphokinase
MPICLIGLGANLGNRRETLDRAVELLGKQPGVRLLAVSRWQETRPAGGAANQPLYLNGAATIETSLAPHELLSVLQAIEHDLGRRRQSHWEARPIDLDLFLYDDLVERSASLVVPHPRMAWRRFVLEPAAQIAPSMVHPVIGWSVARLLEHLNTSPRYVAVTGPAGPENTRFVRSLADAWPVDLLLDAPRRAGNPSGLGRVLALECLRRRARTLAKDDPRWSQTPHFAVSDFWFDESRASALGWTGECEPSNVFRLWRRLEPRVARPRLVVWLDVPMGTAAGEAFGRQLRRREVGPVLRIKNPWSPEATDEVTAAIEAME